MILKMKLKKLFVLRAALCSLVSLLCASLHAEEGSTGHYLPDSIAFFIDGTPPSRPIVMRLNAIYYNGSFGGNSLPIAGLSAYNVKAKSFACGLTLLWRPIL